MSNVRPFSVFILLALFVMGQTPAVVIAQDDAELEEEIGGDAETEDFGELEDFGDEDFADELPAEEVSPESQAVQPEAPSAPEEDGLEALEEDPSLQTPAVVQPEPEPDMAPPPVAEPEGEKDFFAKPVNDEPNLDYEKRLHEIYTKFYSQKTSDEDWNALIGERKAEAYGIQKGDNLWNISKTMFGDGNYWPKVWSLNTTISNPHLIVPQNSIRFVLGDESGPPVFTVTEAAEPEAEPVTEESAKVAEMRPEEKNSPDEPDIPPPLNRSRPVLMKIPPSFPPWQVGKKQEDYDEVGIDYAKRKISEIKDRIPLASYVVEEKINSQGTIHEVETGSRIASALQYLYVLVEPGAANVGDTLVVYRDSGAVESVHSSIKGFLGYSIEVQGEIQLVERLPDSDDVEGRELFRAMVVKVVNPVTIGSSLMKGKMEYFDLREKGERSQVVAQIVGGQYFNRRQVYGGESIAFLNRGSNDGLQPGNLLSIRENREVRDRTTAVRSNVRPIGWLKVIKVTPNLATAVVIRSWSDVVTGDVTGAGELGAIKVPRKSDTDETGPDSAKNSLMEELDGKQ